MWIKNNVSSMNLSPTPLSWKVLLPSASPKASTEEASSQTFRSDAERGLNILNYERKLSFQSLSHRGGEEWKWGFLTRRTHVT